MATALRIERNEDSVGRMARRSQRDSYEEMLGTQDRNFELARDGGRYYFYHMSLPVIIVPSVPGKSSIELYIPSEDMHDPRDSAKSMLKLSKMKSILEKKGYDVGELHKDDGLYYEFSVSTTLKGDLERIARDCNSLVF